jgi:hypothetical protein
MAKHYSKKQARFHIEFRPSQQATAHGGQLAVNAVLEQFGLWQKLKAAPGLDGRKHKGKGYDPEVYAGQVLFCLISGGVSLADAERLDEYASVKEILGIEKFADQTAPGQWLRQAGTAGGVEELRRINREFGQRILAQASPARYLHGGRLECFFDDSQIEVSGPGFQGAKINDEGNCALSWQTLWTGPLLADSVLGPTSQSKESPSSQAAGNDVSGCLPQLLLENKGLWDKGASYLYTDSASSAGKYLEAMEEHFGAWSVSYNKWVQPLEQKAQELPAPEWSAVEQTQWRDGTEHQAQYGWFRYQPAGCQKPKLFAAVRHKGPGELFWRHAFITCQEQTGSAQLAFEHHRLKGDKERAFSERLSDLDLHHPPCQDLHANRMFYALATLAYNALMALKLIHLQENEQPKRVRTLIRHLLMIPVELTRHARQIKAALYVPAGWMAWWRGFLAQWLPRCRQLGTIAVGG